MVVDLEKDPGGGGGEGGTRSRGPGGTGPMLRSREDEWANDKSEFVQCGSRSSIVLWPIQNV